MSGMLRFEILGPQRAWYDDRPLDLGPGKQRAVLAVLLLSAGRPVPTGQIVEAVWPDEPPANGPNVVQKYVAGLRRVLEPDRSPRTPGQVLTLTDAGYLLRVAPEAVDGVRFERGVHRARQRHAEGCGDEALAEVTAALDLWQGEPFTGFAGPFFDTARHRLVELRAVALETRAELELAAGRHRELVGGLVELVAEFPVRERLRYQLMLALYRSGRQAEALAAYRDVGDLLRDEYGIEPGEALQDLHLRILRSDPALAPALPPPVEPPTVGLPAGPVGSPVALPVPPAGPGQPPAPVLPPPPYEPAPADPPWHRTPRWPSVTATVVGALAVLLSFGFLTWLVVLGYAAWRRSWRTGLAAAGYLLLGVTFVVVLGSGDPDAELTDPEGFLVLSWVFAWLVGVLHVVLLNRTVWRAITGRVASRATPPVDERRVRREQARYLLYHYPAARQELHIGRPDLPRTFDDGGLVDINAVSEKVIVRLPGMTAPQARQVAMDRWLRGPFGSMEELAARCLLPPVLTDSLRDLLIFLPPPPPDHPVPHPG